MARRDEGEYPWWIFDRGATKQDGLWHENPSTFAQKLRWDRPGGGAFARRLRWLVPYSPLRGCSELAALPAAKIPRRSTTRNFQTGSKEILLETPCAGKLGAMVHAVVDRKEGAETSSFRETCLKAYRGMLLARVLDDKFASLYRGGKIQGGVFLGRGQEALSVAAGFSLRPGDFFAPLIRDAAGRLAFGETILEAVRTYLGSPLGPMMARDGNVHRGNPRKGIFPMVSHLGATISVVNGVLLASRFKGVTGRVGLASIGEGATSTGSFHEALNQAAVEKLPLVLVVADNQYAYSTPNSRQFACESLVDKAAGYGVEGHTLVGNDLPACLRVVGGAVDKARGGDGPQLVVARLLRLCGHGEHDDASYVDSRLKTEPFARDCMKVTEENLLRQQWVDARTLEEWRNEVVQKVEDAVATVQREAGPDPYQEKWQALSSAHLVEGQDEKP
jgi:acetoin:2,6-dichlorophenolindophenol oxidoreductase subunit alpha